MRIAISIAAAAMLFPVVCSAQTTFRPPTATELFELRSRCGALAAKYAEDERNYKPTKEQRAYYESLGAPGSKPSPPPLISQTSHYDPKSGHCYMLIERTSMRVDPATDRAVYRSLIDAQTNEYLAGTIETKFNSQAVSGKGTYYDGDVSDEKYELTWDRTGDQEHRDWNRAKYENANKYIKQKMSD
jgi:hypothetical protein